MMCRHSGEPRIGSRAGAGIHYIINIICLLHAGSVIQVPDQVRDDGSGTGMTRDL
jgi:hypothetical protein